MLELILILAKAGGILLCLWGSNRLARKLTLIGTGFGPYPGFVGGA